MGFSRIRGGGMVAKGGQRLLTGDWCVTKSTRLDWFRLSSLAAAICIIGAGIFGHLSDSKLGRKGSLTMVCILNVIFGLLTSISPGYWTYVLLRLLTGFSTRTHWPNQTRHCRHVHLLLLLRRDSPSLRHCLHIPIMAFSLHRFFHTLPPLHLRVPSLVPHPRSNRPSHEGYAQHRHIKRQTPP